jgi:hypothetical protein
VFINWGDGTAISNVPAQADGRGGFFALTNHVFPEVNDFTITATVIGPNGVQASASIIVSVANINDFSGFGDALLPGPNAIPNSLQSAGGFLHSVLFLGDLSLRFPRQSGGGGDLENLENRTGNGQVKPDTPPAPAGSPSTGDGAARASPGVDEPSVQTRADWKRAVDAVFMTWEDDRTGGPRLAPRTEKPDRALVDAVFVALSRDLEESNTDGGQLSAAVWMIAASGRLAQQDRAGCHPVR